MNRITLLLVHVGVPILWALAPMVLAAIGLFNYQRLKSLRIFMIVANLVVAVAVITPEIFTQIVAAVGLLTCYEVAVLISYLRDRQKRRRDAI